MIQFDPRAMPLITALIFLLMAGAMLLLRRTGPDDRSADYWAVGNVLIALGVLFIALRGLVPSFVTFPLANTLIVSGQLSLLAGIGNFFGRPINRHLLLGIAAAIFVAISYFTYVVPDLTARIVVGSLFIGGVCGLVARVLVKEYDPKLGVPQILVTALFAIYAIFMVIRSVVTLNNEPTQSVMMAEPIHAYAFILGMVSIITVTFSFSAMINRRLQIHLDHLASYDQLTGAHSRHAFEEATERELSRSRRHGTPLSVMLMDLDHFKQINDSHGHIAGDRVLKGVVDAIDKALRKEDILGRVGGEEFCVLLPDAEQESAAEVSERVRSAVSDLVVVHGSKSLKVTVSIGVRTVDGVVPSWDELFHDVDTALYAAKQRGRNLVVG